MTYLPNHNDFPFSPRRWPFFYGWVIVFCGAMGLLMSAPGQTIGVGPFTESLMGALDLSRDQLSLAYLFGTLASACLLTHAGKLYDRWGARYLAPMACVVMGAVLVLLSFSDAVAAWLGRADPLASAAARVGGLGGVAGPAVLAWTVVFAGYFLLRFSGQGVLTMVSNNMIVKWFDRRRGLAVALSGVMFSLGLNGSPLIFRMLIESLTWRGAWWLLAGAVGVVFSVFALVFFRDEPEACGVVPDGRRVDPPAGSPKVPLAQVRQFSLPEARRSYSFWIFAVAVAFHGLYITALMFNIESIFDLRGMSVTVAYSIFLPASAISITVRLGAGWICDRVQLKYMLAAMLMASGVSVLGFTLLGKPGALLLIIIGNGVAGGLMGVMMAVTWPRFFGRKHLGAISGQAMALSVAFSAVGPWLFSQSLSRTGGYGLAGWSCLAIIGLLLAGSLWANNPQNAQA